MKSFMFVVRYIISLMFLVIAAIFNSWARKSPNTSYSTVHCETNSSKVMTAWIVTLKVSINCTSCCSEMTLLHSWEVVYVNLKIFQFFFVYFHVIILFTDLRLTLQNQNAESQAKFSLLATKSGVNLNLSSPK